MCRDETKKFCLAFSDVSYIYNICSDKRKKRHQKLSPSVFCSYFKSRTPEAKASECEDLIDSDWLCEAKASRFEPGTTISKIPKVVAKIVAVVFIIVFVFDICFVLFHLFFQIFTNKLHLVC